MFRGVNLVREKFFLLSPRSIAVVYIMLLYVNLARLPFCVHPWRFLSCWNCALRGYNSHFAVASGGFSSVKELCLDSVQFCSVWCFSAACCGFPRFAFCSRRCGRSAFNLFRFSVCHYVGRVPAVSVRPSGVMILSRLARFDRFRLARGSLYPLRLFGCFRPCCRPGFLSYSRARLILAYFRLFSALVGLPLPLIVSRLFRGVFGFLALHFIIYPRRLPCQSVNVHFALYALF